MFKFLKLRNSVFGDSRRLVPFRSIIHKPLFIFIALVFSFVSIVPVKVKAAAPQIRPQFKPILDTDIVNFQDSYLNLDPAAQAAASILFGAYVTEYAGLADYGYVFDEVPTDVTLKERLIFIGDQVVDSLFLPVNMADQLVLTPLINLGQGIINKVKGVTNVDDFYEDILDASDYGLSYTPDIGFSLNQLFAKSGGLNNWQLHKISFNDFNWNQRTLTVNEQAQYDAALNLLGSPRAFCNIFPGYSNVIFASEDLLNTYNNLFINLTDNKIYLCDDFGNIPARIQLELTVAYNGGSAHYDPFYRNVFSYPVSQSINQVSDYIPILNSLFNNFTICPFLNSSNTGLPSNLFNVRIGLNFAESVPFEVYKGLGISDTNALQYLNPIKDAVFDLKALLEQIVAAQPDPALELPLKPIIYNITQVDGSPLTAEDLQGTAFNVTPPESGINIPVNAFLPMFDNGKGFISYMWYMTKPLVSYTRSLLDVLTFDPVNGFNASGPGYFVLGVAGLGLIGGIIVKFLL